MSNERRPEKTPLRGGESLALVSDAGTPLVSDPGYRLVREVRAAGLKVSPVPGACAAIAALSVAGIPSDRFCFEGFLPAKGSGRRELSYLLDFKNYFAEEMKSLRELQAQGLGELDDEWIEVTPKGRLLVRVICMAFDRYLREKQEHARYSKVI